MRSDTLIEGQISAKLSPRGADSVIRLEINLFIFHCPPQSLDKIMIGPYAIIIHANLDVCLFQHISKGSGCKKDVRHDLNSCR